MLFRQRFGDLPAGHDGLLTIGVRGDGVVYVSSSVARDGTAPGSATVSAADALRDRCRRRRTGRHADQISESAPEGDARIFDGQGFTQPVHVRLVAVPTPQDGVRTAWEIVLIDNGGEPVAFTTYVDAQTNTVLLRDDLVDYQQDDSDPLWDVFPNAPPLDYSSADTRERWCWSVVPPDCDRVLANAAPSPVAWDVDAATGTPSFTTLGNNAVAVSQLVRATTHSRSAPSRPPRGPNRDYLYDWTNQWFEERCNPATTFTSPQRNDIDAARANLFAMHNQMHDWSYHLGFTEQTFNLQDFNFGRGGAENDPEQGNAQAGGVTGGPPGFAARDNANQITPPDGMAPITNMYLWQPIAGALLRTVRRRRLRHDRDRPRVHPRDQQPHGRRARPPGSAGRRRARWARAGRTSRPSSSSTSTASSRSPTRTRSPSALRHGRQAGGHPQLRDERQPAQLQRRRVRLRVQRSQPARCSPRCTPTARSGARPTSTSGRR